MASDQRMVDRVMWSLEGGVGGWLTQRKGAGGGDDDLPRLGETMADLLRIGPPHEKAGTPHRLRAVVEREVG